MPGRRFEHPGSGIKYFTCTSLPETISVIRYLLDKAGRVAATRRVFAFQMFVLGGVSAYDQLMLARPRQTHSYFVHLLIFDTMNVLGLCFHPDSNMSCDDAIKVLVGAKLTGFLWGAFAVRALRICGLARLPLAPPKPGDPADEQQPREHAD